MAGVATVGLLVAGSGPVFAADPPPSSNQGSSDNVKFKKEVIGSNVLHRGDTVTYKSTIWVDSGVERYIPKVRDVPPAGFALVAGSPKVTYLGATNKATFTNESDGGVSAKCSGSGCNVFGNGFIVKSGQNVTLEASYRVPDNFAFGTYDSGVLLDVWAFGGNPQGANPFNVKVRVEELATTTTLQAPASAMTGQPVTLTANVNPTNAAGQVQFKDAGVNIGSPVTPVNGVASLSHAFGAAGAHSVTAEFVPGAGYFGSTSAAQTVTVTDPDVSTTLAVTVPGTATTGSSVDLTATVSPSNAQGSVQFKDNGSNIGAPVAVANGEAVLPHSFGSAGAHSITAEFSGATGFTNSSAAAQNVTVTDPDVVTSLTVQAPAATETGAEVSLSATVSPANAQGSVQFAVNGTSVGAPVVVSSGAASLPYTFNAAGSFQVSAEFTGAAGFTNSSAAAQNITVTDPDVETSLTVSVPGSATTGTSVDLTATVDPSNAQGTVQFTDNGAPIGGPITVVNGVATLPYTFTSAGAHSIGAAFTGGAGFTDSSAGTPGSITVSDPVQQTALSVAAPATAETGQQVNLSATVTPQNAQGAVQFSVNESPVGAPIAVSAGSATMPYTFNAVGSFEVTAEFTGAAGFTNSTATGQSVTVTDPAIPDVETSTLIGVPPTATTGVETTLSVTVNAESGSAVPTGSVQFRDNGSPIGSPVVLMNGSGSLAHTFSTVGTHQITAVFTADAGFVGSTSTQRPIVVSAPNPVDVPSSVVMTSATSASAGTPFTLTAKVIGAPVLPGTVQFYDGGVALGQPVPVVNGIAELEHTFDETGPHQIHAVYSGGPGVQGSTSQVQVLDVAESGGPGGSGSLGSLGSLSGFRFGS
ncbi:Ig-like domain repeat protein [Prescottella agglutinans]|uniref:Ig-like domain repeat protein n=1 Tax=Prescottella agglutinans TaxID=1644129 RepID=UPI003D99F16C